MSLISEGADNRTSLPSVAVVMATYNGSKFITEQMDSIRDQSVRAGHVIIRDDGSLDGTQELIERYISRHALVSWDFAENATNKGFTNNFLDAALETHDDIVFFSDQDDIWLKKKIENSCKVYTAHKDCLAVLCSSSIIDDSGANADTLHTKSRSRKEGLNGCISLAKQVSSMVSSGHTLSLRRTFLEEIAPYIKERGLTYDSPIGVIAAARGGLYSTGTIDVLHRVHSSNTSTPMYGALDRVRNMTRHVGGRKFQLGVLKECRDEVARVVPPEVLEQYDREIKAREQSISAIEERDIFPLITSIFRQSQMKNEQVEIANLIIALIGRG